MESMLSILLGVLLVAGVAALLWRRNRRRWLIVSQGVRCPLHDGQAEVTVRANPDAPPSRRYGSIAACSLLSDRAVALPEQRAYLPDMPACEFVREPASADPVYATDAPCRQPCLRVLNAASSGTARRLTCASGVSDGLELMRQADRHVAGRQSLWYGSIS